MPSLKANSQVNHPLRNLFSSAASELIWRWSVPQQPPSIFNPRSRCSCATDLPKFPGSSCTRVVLSLRSPGLSAAVFANSPINRCRTSLKNWSHGSVRSWRRRHGCS